MISIGGAPAHYWVYDQDSSTGISVVMIHGLRGTHEGLALIATRLAECGYRVIVPDLPGFGGCADLPTGNTLENYAAWVTEFRLAVASPGAVVVGHSFGSIIVAAAAATIHTPVVLLNPVAVPARHGAHPILARLSIGLYGLAGWLPERLGHWLLTSRIHVRVMSVMMSKTRDPQLRSWIHRQHDTFYSRFATVPGVLTAFRASSDYGVTDFAANLDMPVLLVAGDHDDVTTVAQEERLAAALPNAELVVLQGVGHLIHYERAPETATVIAGFVERRAHEQTGLVTE